MYLVLTEQTALLGAADFANRKSEINGTARAQG
jgi:hypothetical protein